MEDQKTSTDIDDLYAQFTTDSDLERRGVAVNYGRFVVDVARSGGSNQDFHRQHELIFKDVLTALQLGELPEEDARERIYTVFARSVVRRWRFYESTTSEDGTPTRVLVDGLGRGKDGKVVPLTEQNLKALFTKSHDLYVRIRKDSESLELFQVQGREIVAKNLPQPCFTS